VEDRGSGQGRSRRAGKILERAHNIAHCTLERRNHSVRLRTCPRGGKTVEGRGTGLTGGAIYVGENEDGGGQGIRTSLLRRKREGRGSVTGSKTATWENRAEFDRKSTVIEKKITSRNRTTGGGKASEKRYRLG